MFYDEVKGLIKEIQEGWKHRQVIAEKRRRDRKIQNRVDDSDSDLNENRQHGDHHKQHMMDQRDFGGRVNIMNSPYIPRNNAFNRSRSAMSIPNESH